jgi:aryl-alcohol dehydrogenase-like predicted oxidoreductase
MNLPERLSAFVDHGVEFARIPGTPLEVSRIALGTWAIGGWMWG